MCRMLGKQTHWDSRWMSLKVCVEVWLEQQWSSKNSQFLGKSFRSSTASEGNL